MSANVTVLKDELGLVREYREVKRIASSGERVKVVNETMAKGYRNGDDGVVTKAIGSMGVQVKVNGCIRGLLQREYVVLEPTDIIHVNGERFRMVECKADVGDRVVITDAVDGSFEEYGYKNGQVYEVVSMLIDEPFIRPDGTEDSEIYLEHWEYRVLEKIAEPTVQPKPDAQQAAIDGLTETVANLARRLAKAETQLRVAREDIVLIEEGVSEDIRKLEAKVAELEQSSSTRESRCGKGEQSDACGAEYIPSYKPLTRDEIVEKAKADVAELLRVGRDDDALLDGGPFEGRWFDVDFAINRKKRTVVALVHELDGLNGVPYARKDNGPHAKGIAKCTPDDCFNVHIGKVIALRKALELEVPDEYVNTPQPTEPRVGDVVHAVDASETRLFTTTLTRRAVEFDDWRSGKAFRHTHDRGWISADQTIIIDDSRDGRYGEVYSE